MEYKWIAQDEDGRVCTFNGKPETCKSGYWGYERGHVTAKKFKPNPNWRDSLINLETHDYKIEDRILMKVEKTKRQEYADVLIEAANDKYKKLQYQSGDDTEWFDSNLFQEGYRYRLKPKTVKFRNYLTKSGQVSIVIKDDLINPANFVRWIGDWQEVEIE